MKTIEIQKEVMKSKGIASFSHYCHGSIYYNVRLLSGLYQFPISTVDQIENDSEDVSFTLSADLGITDFSATMKAASLNRWIRIANEKGNFIKISE